MYKLRPRWLHLLCHYDQGPGQVDRLDCTAVDILIAKTVPMSTVALLADTDIASTVFAGGYSGVKMPTLRGLVGLSKS